MPSLVDKKLWKLNPVSGVPVKLIADLVIS
jgi:hypothetical protein